jgi:hypothetical protein
MARVIVQERAEALKKRLNGLTVHLWTFVPTKRRAGPRRMQ